MTEIEDQIRRGLRLVAEELEAPPVARTPARARRRFLLAAVGVVVLAAATVFGIFGRSSGSTPRFFNDAFDYKAGTPSYRPGGGFSPSPPALLYSVSILSDVAASSARDAWIVGSAGQHGIAWHWNGTTWQSISSPKLPGQTDLTSVTTVGDGEAWAVGWHSEPHDYRVSHAVIEQWDGSRWRVVPVPYTGPSNLLAVSASGPQDVWAVGESFRRDARGTFPSSGIRPLLLHWDGSSWSRMTVPWPARPGLGTEVAAIGPTDVWVVAGGRIEHWDGSSWRAVPAPFGPLDPVLGFSATSADDAWAVGSYRRAGHSRTLAAHWDGRSWKIAPTPNRGTDSGLTDVVALGPDDVWAVGQSERVKFLVDGGVRGMEAVALFEHWDGQSWQVMRGATPPMWAGTPLLAATSDGTAWGVGSCYFDNVITSWNGSAWAIAAHPPDQHWNSYAPRRARRQRLPSCRPVGG